MSKKVKMNTGWNCKTPTSVVIQAERAKTDILQWWEDQPVEVQEANSEYISDLTRRIRQIRQYISHRTNAP